MKTTISAVVLTVALTVARAYAGQMVVIGNGNVPKMDIVSVQKVYTGKIITFAGVSITPIALKPGMEERSRFLREFIKQDEDKYTAYWTVRRYIGKGVPPVELPSTDDIVKYVASTPGAVGYIDESELKPGMNVIIRK